MASGGGGSGAVGGGAGGGGGPGKANYGPSSPPTGSLPPFYESLKGGGLHGYQQYSTNSSQYQSLIMASNDPLPMDCDTGQDLPGGGGHYTNGGGGGKGNLRVFGSGLLWAGFCEWVIESGLSCGGC